jgi:hypothetical protein
MAFTTPAAAARAAVSVAAGSGIPCADPVILADGANVIVHLTPSPVVAKVAASTAAVRPDAAAGLQRELDVALFLTGEGAPVVPPSTEVPVTTHRVDGQIMSFWTYLPPASPSRPDAATLGSMLRDLHAVLRSYPGAAPWLAPLSDIEAFLSRPQPRLADADVAALAGAFKRLAAGLDPALDQGQVLHGDAGAGNLMATGAGWVWHDFEDVCSGPVAWDLAPLRRQPLYRRLACPRRLWRRRRPPPARCLPPAPAAEPDRLVQRVRRTPAGVPRAGSRTGRQLADAMTMAIRR